MNETFRILVQDEVWGGTFDAKHVVDVLIALAFAGDKGAAGVVEDAAWSDFERIALTQRIERMFEAEMAAYDQARCDAYL